MRAIGLILAGGNNHRMKELSTKRAIAAMPVAGSYRSIDFAMLSFGLMKKPRSLMVAGQFYPDFILQLPPEIPDIFQESSSESCHALKN